MIQSEQNSLETTFLPTDRPAFLWFAAAGYFATILYPNDQNRRSRLCYAIEALLQRRAKEAGSISRLTPDAAKFKNQQIENTLADVDGLGLDLSEHRLQRGGAGKLSERFRVYEAFKAWALRQAFLEPDSIGVPALLTGLENQADEDYDTLCRQNRQLVADTRPVVHLVHALYATTSNLEKSWLSLILEPEDWLIRAMDEAEKWRVDWGPRCGLQLSETISLRPGGLASNWGVLNEC